MSDNIRGHRYYDVPTDKKHDIDPQQKKECEVRHHLKQTEDENGQNEWKMRRRSWT
jgi:hypothetical protein